jgi:predicted Zn-ribbon and HTH transcriptional regulator
MDRVGDFRGFGVILGTIRGVSTGTTRRQSLVIRLEEGSVSFEELRQEFQLTVRVLEEDLRHVQRSLKATGRRLRVENAKCVACGFRFTKPSLHPPGRCPRCRERRIAGPWFRVV